MRALVLSTLFLVSCGVPSLKTSDYANTCTVDSDCVSVYVGPLCGACGGCANTGISTSAKAKYDADVKAGNAMCPPNFGPTPACAPCPHMPATCHGGTCVLH